MTSNSTRNFNCKDEELTIICGFTVFSFERDLSIFTDYSPVYNGPYCMAFKARIKMVEDLVTPKSETVEMKKISDRLFSNINGLTTPLNHIEGYLDMAHKNIQMSKSDFGLMALRKGINVKDPEKVINNLRAVNKNIEKYKEVMMPLGLNEALIERLNNMQSEIAADKQRQYEIFTNRKSIVQNNLGELNGLYFQLKTILKTGKTLFKDNDPVKLQEYTFTELKKRVRKVNKKTDEPKPENPTDGTVSEK